MNLCGVPFCSVLFSFNNVEWGIGSQFQYRWLVGRSGVVAHTQRPHECLWCAVILDFLGIVLDSSLECINVATSLPITLWLLLCACPCMCVGVQCVVLGWILCRRSSLVSLSARQLIYQWRVRDDCGRPALLLLPFSLSCGLLAYEGRCSLLAVLLLFLLLV